MSVQRSHAATIIAVAVAIAATITAALLLGSIH